MNIIAFKMKLLNGAHEEYQRRHDKIWPELISHLHEMGLTEYRIFLDLEDKRTLFAIQTRTIEYDEGLLRGHPIMKKWWDYMADIMLVDEDNSPISTLLYQVFYMP